MLLLQDAALPPREPLNFQCKELPVNRLSLIQRLESYSSYDNSEQQFVAQFLELLLHPGAFERSHLPGHITGSAWICDTPGEAVLLTHHAKLNKWLQPGGHADGDDNVIRVAMREAMEETGLQHIQLVSDAIFDIDIHTIPERKGMPEHLHYDIRYLFRADRTAALTVTEESHALGWFPVADIDTICNGNASMVRMAMKMARRL